MVYRKYKRSTMTRRYRKRPAVRRIARTKSTYTRRRPYRKTSYFTKDNSIVNPPKRLLTRLESSLNLAVAPGATSTGYIFPCQSITDPFGSNGTTQPRGNDRLAQLYNLYMVFGGTMYINYTNETTNPVKMITYIDNDSTNTSGSYEEARQQVGSRELVITEAGGSRTLGRMKRVWSTRLERLRSDANYAIWQATSETGADAKARGEIFLHINFYSQKSSNPANITGVLNLRLFQNVGFQGLKFTDVDTTAD